MKVKLFLFASIISTFSPVFSQCNVSEQCTYQFVLTDAFGDGWNGNTMTVSQNGVNTDLTITSTTSYTETIPVPLCDGIPFTLTWNVGGNYASEVGISIVNSFGQTIYSKPPGNNYQGTVIFSSSANCVTPLLVAEYDSNVIHVSPNPADQYVRIRVRNEIDTIQQILLRDLTGKIVLSVDVNGYESDVSLDSISNGLYLLEINLAGGHTSTIKLSVN